MSLIIYIYIFISHTYYKLHIHKHIPPKLTYILIYKYHNKKNKNRCGHFLLIYIGCNIFKNLNNILPVKTLYFYGAL